MNSQDSRQASQTIIDNNNWIASKKATLIDEQMSKAITENSLTIVSQLGLQPTRDGNQFCTLWGENLQEGIAGFGSTVDESVQDFNDKYYNEKAKNGDL